MAVPMLLEVHGEVLRDIAAATDHHFQGLGDAGCRLALAAGLRRQLRNLDIAAALVRHVMLPMCSQLRDAVRDSLPGMGYLVPTITNKASMPEQHGERDDCPGNRHARLVVASGNSSTKNRPLRLL